MHQKQVGGACETKAAVLAGAVLIHRTLDRQWHVRLALNVIENDPLGAPDQVIRAHSRAFPDPKIVEKRLGLHQRTFCRSDGHPTGRRPVTRPKRAQAGARRLEGGTADRPWCERLTLMVRAICNILVGQPSPSCASSTRDPPHTHSNPGRNPRNCSCPIAPGAFSGRITIQHRPVYQFVEEEGSVKTLPVRTRSGQTPVTATSPARPSLPCRLPSWAAPPRSAPPDT